MLLLFYRKIGQIIIEFPASVAANVPFIPRPYLESNPVIPSKPLPFVNLPAQYGQSSAVYNSFVISPFENPPGIQAQFYTAPQEYISHSYLGHTPLNNAYSQFALPPHNLQFYDQSVSSFPYENTNLEASQNMPLFPSQIINVPSRFVGVLIGKAGRHINEMRRVSRCDVQMVDLTPGVTPGAVEERQFKITGPPQQIAIAVDMIATRLDSERKRIEKYGM